jgi:predicted MFS family arabinose efflux permease
MLLFSLGCLAVVARPAYWPLGVTLVAISVAKVIYDPAMQSYLGDTVPYRQRGKALAITEFSWAGALLLGAPLIGRVIERQGWQAPFFWLALAGLGAAALLWRWLPPARVHTTRAATLPDMVRVVRQHPVIWTAALYTLLAMAANDLLLIVYGEWMEQRFTLSLISLGLATTVIGAAEIVGEVAAGWAVDYFGKRPVIIITGFLTSLAYFLVPYTSLTLPWALATLFIVFFFFETTVVGGMPLMTEVVPTARSVAMSALLAAGSLGRMLGASAGPLVWQASGLHGNTRLAAVVMFVAVLVLARWVREAGPEPIPAASE